ncbi:osmotically inducible protein OsmC [Chitinophaga costaii]|uniref:Osmotically inducible protein OsmC n=1 Tax=Chitinophaga costaii TaxID=1335309 RepID=A0A1C4DS25_9BACT|nr:OsmC family protein [Chitinophaga costaii]PUZ27760.1 OsmC family peroxiredoxin [Chitinophaga costaii]SCC34040.1 osmotically inducible protein OsmC [Chitinophaga costaii]
MKRTATANWKGSGKEGKGLISTQSGVLHDTQYSFGSRFESGIGTNPEELVGAAHAGCFTMKLTFNLNGAGFTPDTIDTKCTINFENGAIVESHLDVIATIPGIDQAKFDELVADAEKNCPISQLLKTKITVDAKLV